MSIQRAWVLALVAAMLAPLTVQAAPAPTGTVVLYTSLPQDIATQFARTFMERNPQVRLEVLRAGSTDIERRIFAEMETGGIRADVLWMADAPIFLTLKARGQLQAYQSPQARAVPAAWKDPQGFFTAGRIINMIIAVNTTLIPERSAPRRWADFPRYGRTAAMPSPLFSGAVFVVAATFAKEYGWEWFQRARREGVSVLQSNPDVTRALAAREYGVGMTLDFIAWGAIRQGAPLAIIWPEEGAVSIPSPVGITKDARNVAGARLFLDFVLSREGQQALVSQGIIPVRADVAPPAGMPRPAEIKTLPIPFEWAAENAAEIRRRFEEIMLR